jgi:sRNA-binding protein
MRLHTRAIPREYLEEAIRKLAAAYPKCFFEDPRLRRPLKTTIESDLRKDGVDEETIAGVNFYISAWTYQRALQAGAERVDLNGKKAGVVTEQEQLNAQNRVREEQEERARRNNAEHGVRKRPVADLLALHAAERALTNQPSDITASEEEQQLMKSPKSAPALTRLQMLLQSVNTILSDTEDELLRPALAAAALRVLVREAERTIASLEGQGQ